MRPVYRPLRYFTTLISVDKSHMLRGANWCGIVDTLQTSAIAATNDYRLKHPKESFVEFAIFLLFLCPQ